MTIEQQAGLVKLASPKLAGTTGELRDQALLAVAKALTDNKDAIFEANRQDMEQAEADGIAAPVLKRLKFDEGKLRDVINGIHDLVQMPDPLFQTKLARELDEGLTLYRETCPDWCDRCNLRGKTGCACADIRTLHQEWKLCDFKGWQ